MADKDNSSATMRMFGGQLRMWRTRARYSREQFADEAGYAPDTVASVEKGRRMPAPDLVEAAETLFGAGGMLRDAAGKIVRSKYPDWFEEYAQYEAEAASLGLYENQVVPGLFQTEEYARAVFLNAYPRLDDAEVERRTAARMERQQLLTRQPLPMISAVIEQVVLQRRIGGRKVAEEQYVQLLKLAELRHVDLQVMPTERESHAGLNGPMRLVETPSQQRLVYFDGPAGGMLISESKAVSDLCMRHAMLRSQALTPEDSTSLLRKMLGDL